MLDTSTVILLGRISDPTELPDESVISAITLAELSVGPHVAHDESERSARQQHLQQAEADFDVLLSDPELVESNPRKSESCPTSRHTFQNYLTVPRAQASAMHPALLRLANPWRRA